MAWRCTEVSAIFLRTQAPTGQCVTSTQAFDGSPHGSSGGSRSSGAFPSKVGTIAESLYS